jgi:DNA-binding NarL/FixJ family response regulator
MGTDRKIVNILIADSQFLIVEALKSLFGSDERFAVVGVANTSFELVREMESIKEGILLVDPFSIDIDSLVEFKNQIQKFSGFRILILTNSVSKTDFMEMSRVGFKNILCKTIDREELFLALDLCLKDKKHYSSEILDLMMEMNANKQSFEENKSLTSSELEIVRLISQGFTTKEIAQRKHVSFHTVNTHRKNIFRKLGVSNASELVMLAIKSGWIDTIEYYI